MKLPAVIVCEPNVYAPTALLLCDELYSSIVSNAVLNVTLVYVTEAEGVQYAVPAVGEVLVEVGAVALVIVTPPAV